jgi:hypothetical protein
VGIFSFGIVHLQHLAEIVGLCGLEIVIQIAPASFILDDRPQLLLGEMG